MYFYERVSDRQNVDYDSIKNQMGFSSYNDILMSEASYVNEIINKTDKDIIYKHYNDFDSDGICEMFVIVGERYFEDNTATGEIWFVNQQGALKLEDVKDYWMDPQVYLFDDNAFIAFEEYYATGSVTYLWGVKDGRPFQPSLTSKANGFIINNYNEVVITRSAYDSTKIVYDDWKVLPRDENWIGHTWNQYYYFWDGSSFKEYGAIEITEKELLQIEGTSEILDYISSQNATINEIYYRANNVIQINYQKIEHDTNATVTGYSYVMFRYDGSIVELANCEIGEGNILKAFNTSLAVYPDGFNIDKLID